jgi:hypothetical protein
MNLLLIDSRLKSLDTFVAGCNETTSHVIYDIQDSFEEIKLKIQNLGMPSFNNVGFVFENEGTLKLFVSYNSFISFDESGIKENLSTQFIKELVDTYNVQTLDFLACDLLNEPVWKSYFDFLQNENSTENSSLTVRASSNKSGNLQHGGDWVLESTNEDITSLYFNENIKEWSHLLDTSNQYQVILSNDASDNIYVCGLLNNSIANALMENTSVDVSYSYFTKMIKPINKKFTKLSCANDYLLALSDEISNNLYICGKNTPFNNTTNSTKIFNNFTNISLQQSGFLNKKIIDIDTNGSIIYVLTDDASNNLYACNSNNGGRIGNNTSTVNNTSFININLGDINGKKIKNISLSIGQQFQAVLTDELSDNLYICGSYSNRVFENGLTSGSTMTFLKVYPQVLTNKIIDKINCGPNNIFVITTELSNNLYACGDAHLGTGSSGPSATYVNITNNIQGKKIIHIEPGSSHTSLLTNEEESSFSVSISSSEINSTFPTSNSYITSSAYSNTFNRIVAVGQISNSGNTPIIVYSDNNGSTWTNGIVTSTMGRLYQVIWCPEKQQFWAIGYGNSSNLNYVHYSNDGIIWNSNRISNITYCDFKSIAWSKEKNMFCICGDYGKLLYSTDGITWLNSTITGSNVLSKNDLIMTSIIWSKELNRFYCTAGTTLIVSKQAKYVLRSSDGITWTGVLVSDTTMPIVSNGLVSVVWGKEINKLIAFGTSDVIPKNLCTFESSDSGQTWSSFKTNQGADGFTPKISTIQWISSLNSFVHTLGYNVRISKDGSTWTSQNIAGVDGQYLSANYFSNIDKLLVFKTNSAVNFPNLFKTTNLYTLGSSYYNGLNNTGSAITSFTNVTSSNISGKKIVDIKSKGNQQLFITSDEPTNNVYVTGMNFFGELGLGNKLEQKLYVKPSNLVIKSSVYVPPVSASSIPVTLVSSLPTYGNEASVPIKYVPKSVNIGINNKINFPDPTKTSIAIAPVETSTAVEKYESLLNVTAKNVVSGYIKLEPAGTTFENHISLEFDVDPFIQPVVYFKSSNDPAPVLIPSSNNSSNDVYYISNTSTGRVVLYTRHFSEAIVTQDLATINPPIGFVLSKFNTLLAMGLSGELFKESIPTMDVSGIAEYYVKASDMRNVFMFQSDSKDINDVTNQDVKYFVRKNQWPQGLVLNPCHAWVQTSKQIASSDKSGLIPDDKQLVKHDFIRYIAKSMFNTHLGVDLFQNESELKYDLAYKGHNLAWDSIWNSITSISDVSLNATTYSGLYGTDASYGYYLTNDSSNNSNICRKLLGQVVSSAPSRLQNISSYAIDLSNGYYSVPLIDGDSISFKLTLQTAPNQHLLLNSATPIQPRSYQIRVNLRDTVTRGTTNQNGTNLIVNDTLPTTYLGSVPTDNLNTSYPANYI